MNKKLHILGLFFNKNYDNGMLLYIASVLNKEAFTSTFLKNEQEFFDAIISYYER